MIVIACKGHEKLEDCFAESWKQWLLKCFYFTG